MIRTTKNYAVQKPFTSQAVIANVNFVMNYVRTSTRDFAHKSINHPEMIYNDREIYVYVYVYVLLTSEVENYTSRFWYGHKRLSFGNCTNPLRLFDCETGLVFRGNAV